MFSILYDEYKKHKTFVRFYMALCIILAFTVGAYAPNVTSMASGAETLSAGDTFLELNDMMFGSAFRRMAGDYSGVVSISAEPYAAMLFIGIGQNINEHLLGNSLNMPNFPLSHPAFLVVIALCFIASKLMKSYSGTRIFGNVTLGYLERYMGTVCVLGIALVSVVGLSSESATSVVSAAELDSTLATGTVHFITGLLASIFSAFMGFMSLIVNFIIRTVIAGVDAIATLFSGIPFISITCETIKTGLVFFLYLITTAVPVLGYILNILVFILCCIIFKACYNAAKYFEQIYFVPFVRKIFKNSKPVPMVPKHIPGYLKKAIDAENLNPECIIPVYVTGKHPGCPLQFKRFERLWLVHQAGYNYLYIRKHKNEAARFVFLNNSDAEKVYVYKRHRYYEIFKYWVTPENLSKKKPKKAFSLVFAKTYAPIADELISRMRYVDIVEQRAITRAEKKAARKAKREESWAEFKNMMDSIFHLGKQQA